MPPKLRPRKFIPGPMLEQQLRRLAEHKYNACGSSLFEAVMQPVWCSFLRLVPLRAAPNALTLAGLALNASSAGLVLWHCPQARQNPPAWVCLYAAAALFAYQTLDALDGKQARRTGSASPLGELFDHGCDAVNTLLVCLCVCAATGFGEEPSMLAAMVAASLSVFYAAHWLGYNTGRLQFGRVDVTEAQVAAMAVFLVTACGSVSIWEARPVPGLLPGLLLRHFVLIFVLVASVPLLSRLALSVTAGLRSVAGTNRLSPGLAWAPVALLAVAAIAASPGALRRQPCLMALALGLPAVKTCQQMIVAQMSRSPVRTFDTCLVWPALLAVGLYLGPSAPLSETTTVCLAAAAGAADLAQYAVRVCWQMAAFLGIRVLHID